MVILVQSVSAQYTAFAKSVVCPVLIGRASQLESFKHVLGQVCGGDGLTVLVAGEAGIGKSRLVAEVKAHAVSLGFFILEGQCFEPDRTIPYAPLLDLLYGMWTRLPADQIIGHLGPYAHDLVKLLPDLAPLLPDPGPWATTEPGQMKRRLFQTLAHLLAQLASTQPVLAIVEDLHWSDATSLEFLLYLARRLRQQPLLLLLTYRADEVDSDLSAFLAELDRERLAAELVLPRLNRSEVDQMVRAIFELDSPLRVDFLETIDSPAEGNPFFIEEILKSLLAAGEIFYADGRWDRKPTYQLSVPRSVREAVRRRQQQLSAAAREILLLAAVAGRRFDFGVLQHVLRCDERELLARIKELIAAQLVVEESQRLAFRHALTRQAIYSELLMQERIVLHGTIAQTIEQIYADSIDAHLADLAHHFYHAGAWAKAFEYAQRAGTQAQALYAPHAAVEHLTRALEAAQRLSLAPRPALHRARGLAYEMSGNFDSARSDLEAAYALARTAENRQEEWQALLDLGAWWASRDFARTSGYYQQALALAHTMDDPSAVAHSLNRVGNWYVNAGRPTEALGYHEQALARFQASNDRRGLAETFDLMGLASYNSGDLVQGPAYYWQAISLFRELDDRQGLVRSLANIAYIGSIDIVVSSMASLPEAISAGEEAARIARAIGWRAGEALALTRLAHCLRAAGAYARALALAQAGLTIAEDIEHPQEQSSAHLVLGLLYLDLLAMSAARQHFEAALALAEPIGSRILMGLGTLYLAEVHLGQKEFARAETLIDAALSSDEAAQSGLGRLAQCLRGELALAQGDPGFALTLIEQLIALAATIESGGEGCIPRLWYLRGEVLAGLGRPVEAEAALQAAQVVAGAQGRRPLLWRSHAALSKLYQAQRRHEEAQQQFSAAQTIVTELADQIPDTLSTPGETRSLRANFMHHALALFPACRPATPRQAAKAAFGGLTARERDVAILIGQGRSNREIADALVVGKRTIETHVGNILAKLSLSTRAQIIAWAIETGLTKPRQ